MKKLSLLTALGMALTLAGGVNAQKKPVPAPPGGMGQKPTLIKPAPKAGDTVSYTGPIKGLPTGDTFILALAKGPVSVHASRAAITYQGKTLKVSDLKGGTFVTVTGQLTATGLTARTVTVSRMPGTKPMTKPGGMGSMKLPK